MSTVTTSTSTEKVVYEARWRHRFKPIIMHAIMFTAVFLVTFPLIYAVILSTQSSGVGSLGSGRKF